MTILSVTDCCRRLGIDAKTLHRWLAQAQLTLQAHPTDGRLKGVTGDQLLVVATAHRESERLPNAVWRAHRKMRNQTSNQRLAHTPELTICVLEQAAATLQAHLK